MNKLNWLAIGLIGVAGVALPKALSFAEYALSNPTNLSSRNSGSVQAQNNSSELTETQNNDQLSQDSPRRLTVTVRVARPEDLFSVNSEQLPVNSEGRNQN